MRGCLDGRVALVCGASSLVGGAVVSRLVKAGAVVAAHANRNRDRLDELIGSLSPSSDVRRVTGDLVEESEVDRIFSEIEGSLGTVDVLINCVHGRTTGPHRVSEMDWSDWQGHLEGLRVHVNVCRRAVVPMRASGRGRIVFISGALSLRPFPGFAAYASAKAAGNAFTRVLAAEEGRFGTTANVVAPGRIEGERRTGEDLERLEETVAGHRAMAHNPSADEVAAVVMSLVAQTGAVTGHVVPITGGELLL